MVSIVFCQILEKEGFIVNYDFISEMNRGNNAIVTIDMQENKVLAGNLLAHKMFGRPDKTFDFSKILGEYPDSTGFIQNVRMLLTGTDTAEVQDSFVLGENREKIPCDLTFDVPTADRSVIVLRACPIVDQNRFILETFIQSRKHPAFTLNVYENLKIVHGNDEFYRTFACTVESMAEKYDNQFISMLSEDSMEDDESQIFTALKEKPCGILDVKVQTARGESLYFYYDTEKLKLVEPDWNSNLFCMLVEKDTPLEQLEAEWNQPLKNFN